MPLCVSELPITVVVRKGEATPDELRQFKLACKLAADALGLADSETKDISSLEDFADDPTADYMQQSQTLSATGR